MKKLRTLVLMSAILCCLLALTGCGAKRLYEPSGLVIDPDTLTLTWTKVKEADGYLLKINEREIECRKPTYELSDLDPGNYVISVMARGDGDLYKDSNWSETIDFKKEVEAPLDYKAINNNTAYEVVGVGDASGDIVVDAIFRGKPVVRIADAAFANCVRASTITLPESITYIGSRAFYNCTYLTSLNIPEGVTFIGDRAFQSCRQLTTLEIPEAITVIQPYMFSLCRELTTLKLGSKITTVGDNAFSDCESLTEITLPDTVTTIGSKAFQNCTGATKIDIGDNVVSVGEYAFYKCSALKEVNLGAKLETIGAYAFAYCPEITSVTLPDGVTAIPNHTFFSCEKLDDVTFGEDMASIAQFAFHGTKIWNEASDIVYINKWLIDVKDDASQKTDYEIAEDTVGIAAQAFIGCDKFYSLFIPNSVKYIGDRAFYALQIMGIYFGDEDIQEGEGVITIGREAFAFCENINTIKIFSQQLKEIKAYAFVGCSYLAALDLPDSVEKIGTYAFYNTRLWTNADEVVYVDNWAVGLSVYAGANIRLREGTVGISDYAFYAAKTLTSMTIADSVKYIGVAAFYGCEALTTIVVPEGVEVLENYTFYNCTALQSATLPSTLVEMGRSIFYMDIMLKQVNIPGSLEAIGDYAFYFCLNLKDVTIGEGVKHIGKKSFHTNVSLTDIRIPDSVESMGEYAFFKCEGLQRVRMSQNLKAISDYAFYGCISLQEMLIPDSVEVIGKSAFRNCANLKTVSLGNGLKQITDYAFYACGMESIAFPASLTSIGNYAFRNNDGLASVVLPETLTNIGKHAFYGCDYLSFYTELAQFPTTWDPYWNSSFRPVITQVELSDDKTYVVSFTAPEKFTNYNAVNGIGAPTREGFVLVGWSLTENSDEVEYDADEIYKAVPGETLYAIWD